MTAKRRWAGIGEDPAQALTRETPNEYLRGSVKFAQGANGSAGGTVRRMDDPHVELHALGRAFIDALVARLGTADAAAVLLLLAAELRHPGLASRADFIAYEARPCNPKP